MYQRIDEDSTGRHWRRAKSVTEIVGRAESAVSAEKVDNLMGWAAGCAANTAIELMEMEELDLTEDEIFGWIKNAYERQRSEAADAGTKCHSWAESYLQKRSVILPMGHPLHRFTKWFSAIWISKDYSVGKVQTERIVFDYANGVAGTADMVFHHEVPNTFSVGDLKTGNWVGQAVKIQLAAYAEAYALETGMEHRGGVVFHAPLRSEKQPWTVKALPKDEMNKSIHMYQMACEINEFFDGKW